MRNHLFLLPAITLATLQLSGSPATAAPRSDGEKPDVLFIAIDDMNDWTTLFDENNPIQTPNLRRLAKRGTFFTHAYSVVPACNPSRTAILTGYSPRTTNCYDNKEYYLEEERKPDAVTLPEYFRGHGYLAQGAGKIFHHGAPRDSELNALWERGRGPERAWDDFQPWIRERQVEQHNGYQDGRLSKVAFDWGEHRQKLIDEDMLEYVTAVMGQQQEGPLFLGAGIFKPHLPFYAPPRFFDWYPRGDVELPLMPPGDLSDIGPIGREMAHREDFQYTRTMAKPDNDPGSHQRLVQSYQASASYADNVVGRLLDKLDATGRSDDTIIVLWSDHGYHLGDKESCVKFTLWEKANHVPLVIVAPGITEPGSRVDQPVTLLNLFPTLVELCGLPAKDDLDGHSLVPLLKDPDAQWDHPAIMTMGRGNYAVRTKRWRYIRYHDGAEELYDHKYDPWEWSNLAGDDRYAETLRRLRSKLPSG